MVKVGEYSMKGILESLHNFLMEKNKRYGNSVLNPIGVFGKHVEKDNPALNAMLVRIDDKLKRIQNADVLRKNDVVDLMGYLTFLCLEREWGNFDDLID